MSFGFFFFLSSVFPVFIVVIFLCFSFETVQKILNWHHRTSNELQVRVFKFALFYRFMQPLELLTYQSKTVCASPRTVPSRPSQQNLKTK